MSTQRELIFAFLDVNYAGDRIEDYDSRKSFMDSLTDAVSCEEELTMGCGVGPVISDIEDWIEMNEQRSEANLGSAYQTLRACFKPAELGYVYIEDRTKLDEAYPKMFRIKDQLEPEQYPVFAKRVASIGTKVVLDFLYPDKIRMVP